MVRRVFVDTSALMALLDRADPHHDVTRATFQDLADDELVTHGYVVAESVAVTRRRLGADGVIALIDELLPMLEVVAVEPTTHAAALARHRETLPSGISFVDRISIEVMARDGPTIAFALDPDLAGPGVTVLPG